MKGLQGERLRQAFKHLDSDQDGFIRPDEFKRIILVRNDPFPCATDTDLRCRKLLDTNYPVLLLTDSLLCAHLPPANVSHTRKLSHSTMSLKVSPFIPQSTWLTPRNQRWIWWKGSTNVISVLLKRLINDRIIREATAKSKDGRIDQSDFLNHAASSSRYSLFTPMEASIIFHFASRGMTNQRLALIDFAQLLDARWRAPSEIADVKVAAAPSGGYLHKTLHSAYNFVLGGMAGAFGATIVYPIDMGK